MAKDAIFQRIVINVATPDLGPTRLAGLNRNPGDSQLPLYQFIKYARKRFQFRESPQTF